MDFSTLYVGETVDSPNGFYCSFQDYEQLKGSHQFLQMTCDDQEKALAELGSHLSQYVTYIFNFELL
jgi:hypothetical protein